MATSSLHSSVCITHITVSLLYTLESELLNTGMHVLDNQYCQVKNDTILLFYFVVAVGKCGLCLRRCLACSSYTHMMHCALVITCVLRYDPSAKH